MDTYVIIMVIFASIKLFWCVSALGMMIGEGPPRRYWDLSIRLMCWEPNMLIRFITRDWD